MKLLLALLAAVALAAIYLTDEVRHPPGVLVLQEPRQVLLAGATSWEKDGYRITPLAAFDLRARVLGTERYWFDAGSHFAPLDLAVGWGPMSDSSVLDGLWMTQGRRWYL